MTYGDTVPIGDTLWTCVGWDYIAGLAVLVPQGTRVVRMDYDEAARLRRRDGDSTW